MWRSLQLTHPLRDLVWLLRLRKLVSAFDPDFAFTMPLLFTDAMLVLDMVGEW